MGGWKKGRKGGGREGSVTGERQVSPTETVLEKVPFLFVVF